MNKYLSNGGYGTLLIDLIYQHKNNNTHTEINIWESQNPDRLENKYFVTNKTLKSQKEITVNKDQRMVIDDFVDKYNTMLDKFKEEQKNELYEKNFFEKMRSAIEDMRETTKFQRKVNDLRNKTTKKLYSLR